MLDRTVLVVEDEPLLRELLVSMLGARGFTVLSAGSVAEAREVMRESDVDGLLVDVQLGPGPTGFDFVSTIAEQSPCVGVVILTNLPDPRFAGQPERRVPAGMAYLRKSTVTDIDVVAKALDATMRGALPAAFRDDRNSDARARALTRGQIDVLTRVSQGWTNAQIAQSRGVREKAIEDTLRRAAGVLEVPSGGNMRVAVATAFVDLCRGLERQSTSEDAHPTERA